MTPSYLSFDVSEMPETSRDFWTFWNHSESEWFLPLDSLIHQFLEVRQIDKEIDRTSVMTIRVTPLHIFPQYFTGPNVVWCYRGCWSRIWQLRTENTIFWGTDEPLKALHFEFLGGGGILTAHYLIEPVRVGWCPCIFHIPYNKPLTIVCHCKTSLPY